MTDYLPSLSALANALIPIATIIVGIYIGYSIGFSRGFSKGYKKASDSKEGLKNMLKELIIKTLHERHTPIIREALNPTVKIPSNFFEETPLSNTQPQ